MPYQWSVGMGDLDGGGILGAADLFRAMVEEVKEWPPHPAQAFASWGRGGVRAVRSVVDGADFLLSCPQGGAPSY